MTVQDGKDVTTDSRVRVFAGTDAETAGVVVDDFGEAAGFAVEVGGNHIADPARRYAVLLDDGGLVFADTADLAAE